MAGKKYIDMKEEDSVEYFLFPNLPQSSQSNKINLHLIDETMENINKIVRKLSENYIWHNDEFFISYKNLVSYVHSSNNEMEPFSYYGTLNYGENIEDEWFLVFLLMELTKEIDGLVVRVKDSDGEFLLIEAAEHLPSWVTPETCEDKVFLFNGELRILPKSFAVNEDYTITQDVIDYVRQHPEECKVNLSVLQAIQNRIKGYPEKMENTIHNTILYVPVAVASLLNAQPKLIAPAVRAFCERDLIDVKACRAMKFFPPENRVYSQIKFTRCLYAMLVSSRYVPDRRTGWNLPSPNEDTYKSHLLGIKVACGFEILTSQAKSRYDKDDEVEEIDFNNDPNWNKFLKSLTAKNYFRGLLQYSKEHNQLLESAKEYYKNSCEKSVKPSKAKLISDLLDKLEVDIDELKMREKNLPKSDDDDWMNLSQKDLDEMLEARFGTGQNDIDMVNGYSDIGNQLNKFINHLSGVEGVEFPKKESKSSPPTRPKRGVKNKKRKTVKFTPDTKLHSVTSVDGISNAHKSNKIDFQPDGFINVIQNILDFSIPDDNYWESEGSGMSSYEDEIDVDLGEAAKPKEPKKDEKIVRYMDQMDEELSKTSIAKSFIRKEPGTSKKEDTFDDIETFQPVDIDLNALKNIISSYKAQMGEAGPAENILGPLGVNLDDIDADVD